ncbi:MAG: hypothetical protein ACR2PQ_12740 [Myxococcota bacterium]
MKDFASGLYGWLGNLLLATASVAATLAFVELVMVPLLLDRLPLADHGRVVNRAVRMLAQSSKASVLPRDYVALVGDSYAEGEGDWHLAAAPGSNPPFHSAHLIRDRTGRDVLSFGHAGAGSLRGLVTEPTTRLAYLRRTARFEIEKPSDVVVYFYEGNDVDNNLEDLARRFDPRFGRENLRDPATFERFLEEVVVGEDTLHEKTERFRFIHNFYLLRSLRWGLVTTGEPAEARTRFTAMVPTARVYGGRREQRSNHFVIAGEPVSLRLALQAPPLELDAQELDDGAFVFQQALEYLAELLPEARISVLYVPAPLSVYPLDADWVVVQVDDDGPDRPAASPAALLHARSDAVCALVEEVARENGVAFRDARPELRAAAARELVHGPLDWKHLNRAGYHALSDAVVPLLGGEGRACVSIGDDPHPRSLPES